ncbi:hypothetical protein Purlil1_6327 [Purpureocillium lilacinum]|uniref:Uncharacterized protein n=1 Tax=Purpureocillium lilacinum TaxID=33203 RepID=A0ABR0BZ10_PURLI|nr:hypothetical protein Purlil1_6327 [Purpureocillium lilacinum]
MHVQGTVQAAPSRELHSDKTSASPVPRPRLASPALFLVSHATFTTSNRSSHPASFIPLARALGCLPDNSIESRPAGQRAASLLSPECFARETPRPSLQPNHAPSVPETPNGNIAARSLPSKSFSKSFQLPVPVVMGSWWLRLLATPCFPAFLAAEPQHNPRAFRLATQLFFHPHNLTLLFH